MVVRRYLAAYGPATRDEFGRWFGLTSAAHAERLITGLGGDVVRVDRAGTPAWLLAEDLAEIAAAAPSGSVRLLPAFDQYVVTAPRHVPAVLPPMSKDRVYRPQGWLSPVLLVGGRIAGVWRHERSGNGLAVRVEPFALEAASVRQEAREEADRLAAFFGTELDFAIAAPPCP